MVKEEKGVGQRAYKFVLVKVTSAAIINNP